MKINLNNTILDSKTYLVQLFDNKHINHSNYNKYITLNDILWQQSYHKLFKICNDYKINIYPYLYTLERITIKEKKSFTLFFITYMKKCEFIDLGYNINSDPLDLASLSLENLLIFIFTIQYFFI